MAPDAPAVERAAAASPFSTAAALVRALVLVPVVRPPRRSSKSGAAATANAPSASKSSAIGPAIRHDATRDPSDRLSEATGLAAAIDLDIVEALTISLSKPRAATLFGRGKIDELRQTIEAEEIELVIVDHAVTPIQQRNLERAWHCKVVDRTGLILEIFGKRARTSEGRLQVELAHLTYQKGRLVRSWTHLERQRGGAGFLGGPGERQIELDRRMIQTRIDAITKDLEGVVKTRQLHRLGRKRLPYPVVALVGYTNAGKSTLFNLLTGAGVAAQDQVFATLDPTMREVVLSSKRRMILSDTVGFIAQLPTMLVAAFRATLEEVVEADVILHVRDISHKHTEAQQGDVDNVLRALGLAPNTDAANIIEVWNKIDLIRPDDLAELANAAGRAKHQPVLLSAVSGEGVGELLDLIDARLGDGDEELTIQVPAHEGALINWLHENCEVLSRDIAADQGVEQMVTYNLRLPKDRLGRLQARLKAAGLSWAGPQ